MENDTIRSSGGDTLVDLWVEGKMRGICVSRGAIEANLGLPADKASAMSEDDRCEFVRTHLAIVMNAAKARLREDPTAETIVIGTGQLGGAATRGGDRRVTERRKGERRKENRPQDMPPSGDRRRVQRRKSDRRAKPKSG